MSQTVKFANGTEYPLAAAPEISGGYGNLLITPSASVTAEAVRTEVSDYNNTKSFQIGTNGAYGSAITYYYLSGNVSLDDSGNIIVPLRQKTQDQQQADAQAAEISNLKTMLALFQLAVDKKLNGGT